MARLRDLEEKNQKLKKAYVVKRDQAQDLEKRVESLEEELNSCKKELQEWEERSQKSKLLRSIVHSGLEGSCISIMGCPF